MTSGRMDTARYEGDLQALSWEESFENQEEWSGKG